MRICISSFFLWIFWDFLRRETFWDLFETPNQVKGPNLVEAPNKVRAPKLTKTPKHIKASNLIQDSESDEHNRYYETEFSFEALIRCGALTYSGALSEIEGIVFFVESIVLNKLS